MSTSERAGEPIWASWKVRADGALEVVITYRDGDGYVQRPALFASLDAAGAALGPSFREVVERSIRAGSHAGRWQR
jgi:hypothetical protein